MSWECEKFEDLPLIIEDGDRGKKYPKSNEFSLEGYCLFLNTKNVLKSGFNFDNLAFINKEKDQSLRKGKLKRNDIVLTTRGTLGHLGYYSDNVLFENIRINSGMVIIRCNNTLLDPCFLYQQLKSNDFQMQISNARSGSAQPQLPIGTLNKLTIHYPKSLPTQKRIADILSGYDDLIENNLKRIKLLEQAAQNIYKEWFVNLRFPGHENSKINEKTGLPEGWEEKNLGDTTDIKKGKNITKSTITEGNVPVVAGGLSPAYYHDTSNTINPVITVSASGANAGYINIYLEDIWASDCSYIDSNMSDKIFFIHNLLIHQQDLIFGMQRGAAQPHVYPKDLLRVEMVIPESKVVNQFEKTVLPLYDLKRVLLIQNQKLKSARDILLPRLMNRTIEV